MALFDFLKRKKEADKAKEKKAEKKPDKSAVAHFDEPATISPKANLGGARRNSAGKGFSYEIVKEPHISEKATNLSEKDQYTFKVQKGSNKTEIKKAVEGIYGVNVLSVNIIKIPQKKRRLGKTHGFRTGYTKAVVTLKQGQKIEIF